MCAYTCAHIYIHTHTYTYVHTHTYLPTHTCPIAAIEMIMQAEKWQLE